jgi:hypothetical protein
MGLMRLMGLMGLMRLMRLMKLMSWCVEDVGRLKVEDVYKVDKLLS